MNKSKEKCYNNIIEKYLKLKELQEKSIEKYLEGNPVDLREVEFCISLLTQNIRLIEHYKLLSEGKDIEAFNNISSMEHFTMLKNELLKKYNIEQEIQDFHKQDEENMNKRNYEEKMNKRNYELKPEALFSLALYYSRRLRKKSLSPKKRKDLEELLINLSEPIKRYFQELNSKL